MNYEGKRVAITGFTGFLGSHLVRALESSGADVVPLIGDVRNASTYAPLDHTIDYLFHFGAPSSQVLFKQRPMISADVTLNGFMQAVSSCAPHGIKLIYPSTGLLSVGPENEYARCKKVCEQIHIDQNVDAVGIRIFGTYGPGEGHKRDYASVPYLFCRAVAEGRPMVIYGDGKQERDFIFIEDTVQGILEIAENSTVPIVDLGSGTSHSFNEIMIEIAFALGVDISSLKVEYVPKPSGYVKKTASDNKHLYYQPKVRLYEGIRRTLDSIMGPDVVAAIRETE